MRTSKNNGDLGCKQLRVFYVQNTWSNKLNNSLDRTLKVIHKEEQLRMVLHRLKQVSKTDLQM